MSDEAPKGRRGNRPTAEQERRQAIVGSLYLKGRPILDIADAVGVSRATVTNDVKAIRKRWVKSAQQSYERQVATQLAKLDELESAAWNGWERSCRDELITTTEDGFRGDVVVDVTRIQRRIQSGDPRFLTQIANIIRQRCEILGLLDEDARNEMGEETAETVTVVVESREEAAEFQALSMDKFKKVLSRQQSEPANN